MEPPKTPNSPNSNTHHLRCLRCLRWFPGFKPKKSMEPPKTPNAPNSNTHHLRCLRCLRWFPDFNPKKPCNHRKHRTHRSQTLITFGVFGAFGGSRVLSPKNPWNHRKHRTHRIQTLITFGVFGAFGGSRVLSPKNHGTTENTERTEFKHSSPSVAPGIVRPGSMPVRHGFNGLPGQGFTIGVAEAAGVVEIQLFDPGNQAGSRFARVNVAGVAGHAGAHIARMQQANGNAALS